MGTIQNALKALHNANTTAAASGARVPILNSSNELMGSDSYANFAKKLQSVLPTIGNVMVVTNEDSYTRFWPADRALESSIASIAVGVGIIENGRTLIVAKDQASKAWATSNVTGGTTDISDRRTAIQTACMIAQKGDIILIAGKGHENYQDVMGVKHHFDDKEIATEILQMQAAQQVNN
jgi:hypothetical protein